MAMFRILSLDGGGLMGAFSASVLATLERTTGHRIVDHFDLITGTSTGGIIAIGLASGAQPIGILAVLPGAGRDNLPGRGGRRVAKPVRNLRGPKFSPDALRGPSTVVGDQPDAARTGLVMANDVSMGASTSSRRRTSRRSAGPRLPAVDVALATSAAPTTSRPQGAKDRGVFVDGGVWANCPAVVGVVEALAFGEQRLEDLHALSVSTTSYRFRMPSRTNWGCWAGAEGYRDVHVRPGPGGGRGGRSACWVIASTASIT